MLNINEDDLKAAIVAKASDEILRNDEDLSQIIGREVTARIDWSMSSNKTVTPELVGLLCGLEGTEIIATLTPPAIATGPVIDGSTEAFERDHPKDERQPDLLDAGSEFARQHGSGEGAE